jgi:5'-nucleotidase
MNILVTNDDGVYAPGIQYLIKSLPKTAKIAVSAPNVERSATSHSISLRTKLKVESFEKEGVLYYAVHGTPADSVKVALSEIPNFKPDVVISGINQGANTGVSVYYSGTVAAAREAFINGIPSFAISLANPQILDFSAASRMANLVLQGYAEQRLPLDVMLNVNVPPLPWDTIRGIKITKQAASRFIKEFVPESDEGSKKVFTLTGEIQLFDSDGTSDEEAVTDGYISVTPLKLDMTDYHSKASLDKWLKSSSDHPGGSL